MSKLKKIEWSVQLVMCRCALYFPGLCSPNPTAAVLLPLLVWTCLSSLLKPSESVCEWLPKRRKAFYERHTGAHGSFTQPSTFRKQIITGCIMWCSIMSESIVTAQDCWMRYYSMCSNCKMMIILYDPFNDRYGDFFSQLVFSTYLSEALLNTSHNLRGKEHKFGMSLDKMV